MTHKIELSTGSRLKLEAIATDYIAKSLPELLKAIKIEENKLMTKFAIETEVPKFCDWYIDTICATFEDSAIIKLIEGDDILQGVSLLLMKTYTQILLLGIVKASYITGKEK